VLRFRRQADATSETLWIREPGGWSASFDFRLWGEERGDDLLMTLADWLQEQFFPESDGAWAQARPACPCHTHPACADEVDAAAWWRCPLDDHQIAAVGRFGR
jgi:hypothetical protein